MLLFLRQFLVGCKPAGVFFIFLWGAEMAIF